MDQCRYRRPVVCHDRLQHAARSVSRTARGYDAATAGNPADDDYLFNLMVQNMDGNIGRLIGTSGQPGGRRYFPPIAADQLSNTIIVFIGDNGTPAGISLEEHKTEIYEGGVRVPMIITDGQALMNEINGRRSVRASCMPRASMRPHRR